MSIVGNAYGVVLNDGHEILALADRFAEKPYGTPPAAPVVYLKPRQSFLPGGGTVHIPRGAVAAAPTIILLFAADSHWGGWDAVGAAALALDVSLPKPDYYRPAVAQRSGEGMLPFGTFGAPHLPAEIVTFIDGAEAHRWALSRLVRDARALIAELSAFMTFMPGDALLVGLPGDAPRVQAGQSVTVKADGFADLTVNFTGESQ